MKNVMNGVFVYNDKDYEFNFATDISAYEKIMFVNSVVDSVVDGDYYNLVAKDLIFDFYIVDVFTNVDTSFIDDKDNDGNAIHPIILIEHFLNNSNIVDVVKANVKPELLAELNYSVDKCIEYRTGIHTNYLNEALTSLIDTIERKIGEIDLAGATDVANMLSGITEDFTLDNIVSAYIESNRNK